MFSFFFKNKEAIQTGLKILAYVAVIVIEAIQAIVAYINEHAKAETAEA